MRKIRELGFWCGHSEILNLSYTKFCLSYSTRILRSEKFWALDDYLDPSGTVDAATLRKAMKGHVLGTGQLKGTYRRV